MRGTLTSRYVHNFAGELPDLYVPRVVARLHWPHRCQHPDVAGYPMAARGRGGWWRGQKLKERGRGGVHTNRRPTTFDQQRKGQRSGAESQRRLLRRRRELEGRAAKETRGGGEKRNAGGRLGGSSVAENTRGGGEKRNGSGRLGGSPVAVGRPEERRQLSAASKEAAVGNGMARRLLLPLRLFWRRG